MTKAMQMKSGMSEVLLMKKESRFSAQDKWGYRQRLWCNQKFALGKNLTAEMAKAALVGEQLGKGNTTDFLAISFDRLYWALVWANIDRSGRYIYPLRCWNSKPLSCFWYTSRQRELYCFFTADHGVARRLWIYGWALISIGGFMMNLLRRALNIELAARFGRNTPSQSLSICNYILMITW